MKVIGLTGGIATGKSTVLKMFQQKNIPVIDTDKIARDVMEINQAAYFKVVAYFGKEILLPTGDINRKKLGEIIFKNKEKREKLNSLVHPEVKKVVLEEIKYYQNLGHELVVVDVPLLFESNFDKLCDITIVVYTEEHIQYERLMKRDNLSYEEAKRRIDAQMKLSEKVKLADFIIDNSSTIEETEKQLINLLNKICVL